MKSDLHISQEKKLKNISDIAKKIGLKKSDLFLYGEYIAKIKSIPKRTKNAKLILVTAMSPTPAGEGKTTTTVGLSDALQKIGKKNYCLFERAIIRTCFWNERGSNWRWLLSGSTHGRD